MSKPSNDITMEPSQLLDDIILHEADLSEEAKNRFGYHTDILRALDAYKRSILHNNHLTRNARHVVLSELAQLHASCKRVLNYVTENSELLSHSLPAVGPLVICGLPRTGTTLLYNLLACDPNCRAPLYTEMAVECIPPIQRSNSAEHEQRAAAAMLTAQQRNNLLNQGNAVASYHACFAIEEDYFILRQAGLFVFFTAIPSDDQSESDTWMVNVMNKHFAYDYHETFLRMLNSVDMPRSHWLLKSPIHSLYLDTLLHHYPHAALVMVHRRLDEVLPSFCHLMRYVDNSYFAETDASSREASTRRSIQFINKMVECIVEFHTRSREPTQQSHKNSFHVFYDDLMEQPIDTVRQIYDHFGLSWSDEFEVAMQAWVRENPQGKQGRQTYNLAAFNLTHEDIEARYADYIKLFLRSSPLNTASSDQDSTTNKQVSNV